MSNYRATKALIWKEANDSRWALYLVLILTLTGGGLDIILSWTGSGFIGASLGAVVVLGLPLALLVGVGSSCRDLGGGVELFWRSKPINPRRYMSIKFLTGLSVMAVMFAIGMVPPLVMILWKRDERDWSDSASTIMTLATSYGWMMASVYSLAFLIGALLRRAASAAILSLAVVGLLVLGPLLFPPLGFMNLTHYADHPGLWLGAMPKRVIGDSHWFALWGLHVRAAWVGFVAALAALIAASAALAALAVVRQWRIKADQKLVAWALVGVSLLLLGSAAYQVGSNIEPVMRLDIGQVPGEVTLRYPTRVVVRDGRGVMQRSHGLITFDLNKPNGGFGPLVRVGGPDVQMKDSSLYWSPDQPQVAYVLAGEGEFKGKWNRPVHLLAVDLTCPPDDKHPQFVSHALAADLLLPDSAENYYYQIYRAGQRLYIGSVGNCWIVDVSQPLAPKLEGEQIHPKPTKRLVGNGMRWDIWDVPGLTTRQQLEFRAAGFPGVALGGDLLVLQDDGPTLAYRIGDLTATGGKMTRLPGPNYTPLQQLRRVGWWGDIMTNGRWLAKTPGRSNEILFFDASDAGRMRQVGHYTRPHASLRLLAFDGENRLLVGSMERGQELLVFDLAKK